MPKKKHKKKASSANAYGHMYKKRKHYAESSRYVVREIGGRKIVKKDTVGYYDPCPVGYRRPTEVEVRAKERSEQSLIDELKKLLAHPKYNKNTVNVTEERRIIQNKEKE